MGCCKIAGVCLRARDVLLEALIHCCAALCANCCLCLHPAHMIYEKLTFVM